MRSPVRSCLLVCLTLAASVANAQTKLDQSQTMNLLPMGGFYQTGLAQSFQTSADMIAGAGIQLWPRAEESGPVTIALWDALPTQGGTKLAEGTSKGTPDLWVDVFWSPVTAVANKTYYLTLSSDTEIFIVGGMTDNYSKGMAYANDYTAFAQYDYTFRTFSAPRPVIDAPPPAVPEPASVAMLLAGLGVLSLARRRKTAQAAPAPAYDTSKPINYGMMSWL
ncbi:VPLPA-CTERM sorting domain-containing protein [Duganella callida]|uniref:VPLPA-CTERM sorting domain-containing protein n=1 Tax=Duganella callida TaxID=2561932 RepID=A0A4Y9SRG6_9BURK|nr:VPLPA-CTERM sorting domain-containing protein [Duganella callida]TFW29048.1 VPLPA-CTERM sorting domain-containing protein [Duganella callida]